jgi:putative oxidoreductase
MLDVVAKNTIVPLILRLGLAAIFIFHGSQKVNPDNDWGATWANNMKLPDPPNKPAQLAVAWGELIGGIALAAGFMTRLAALGIGLIQAGAIYTTTGKNGFDVVQHGYEYNFLIIVVCVSLILMGGGTLAVDRVFRLRRRRD